MDKLLAAARVRVPVALRVAARKARRKHTHRVRVAKSSSSKDKDRDRGKLAKLALATAAQVNMAAKAEGADNSSKCSSKEDRPRLLRELSGVPYPVVPGLVAVAVSNMHVISKTNKALVEVRVRL